MHNVAKRYNLESVGRVGEKGTNNNIIKIQFYISIFELSK